MGFAQNIKIGTAGNLRDRKHSREFPEGHGILPGSTKKEIRLLLYVRFFFFNNK